MAFFFSLFISLLICASNVFAQTQCLTDSFTYSNGNLSTVSTTWTQLSGIGLVDMVVNTNAIRGAASDSASVITTWPGSTADQYAEMTANVKVLDSGGPTLRSDTATIYYYVRGDGVNGITLFRVSAGPTFTSIHANAGSYLVGDVLRGEIQGTTINVKVNGTSQYTQIDSGIATGKPGAGGSADNGGGAGIWDNWAAGSFTNCGSSSRRMSLMGVGP